jgi:hypothetical protein
VTDTQGIKLGGKEIVLERAKGYKALYIAEMLSDISTQVTEIIGEVQKKTEDYERDNKVTITRQMAQARGWDDIVEKMERENAVSIEVSEPPSAEQQVMFGFPLAFKLVQDEVLKLLALIAMPNDELKKLRRSNALEEHLLSAGDDMMADAEIGEIITLVAAAAELVQEQLDEQAEKLGKLQDLRNRFLRRNRAQSQASQSAETRQTVPTVGGAVRTMPRPESPTPSPELTDGAGTNPSTASTG